MLLKANRSNMDTIIYSVHWQRWCLTAALVSLQYTPLSKKCTSHSPLTLKAAGGHCLLLQWWHFEEEAARCEGIPPRRVQMWCEQPLFFEGRGSDTWPFLRMRSPREHLPITTSSKAHMCSPNGAAGGFSFLGKSSLPRPRWHVM